MPGQQFLWLGGKAEERGDLSLDEKRHWFYVRAGDPVDVLDGIQPHIRRHAGQEYMRARTQRLHADALALQVSDPLYRLVSEQLETAGVHAGKHNDRTASIH